MTTRTRVSYTYEESAPGVPFWGPNAVTTDLPTDATQIAIENLLSGKRYYIKTWNEDEFGNKSRELLSTLNTPPPTRLVLLPFDANGYLDSGSPMRAYVSIPSSVQTVSEAIIKLAFRPFMAPAQDASASGTLTSATDGGSTTPSGGGSTTPSGGGSTAGNTTLSITLGSTGTNGNTGAASAGTAHTHLAGSIGVNDAPIIAISDHSHTTPSHTHTTPSHTHTTPDHSHSVPSHTHSLTYGTFEETYPASHNVTLTLYKWSGTAWVSQHVTTGITADVQSVDWTPWLNGPGDWRIEAQSAAAQPNGGRLGLDLFATLSVTVL